MRAQTRFEEAEALASGLLEELGGPDDAAVGGCCSCGRSPC